MRGEKLRKEANESYQRGLAEGREQGRAEERERWEAKVKQLEKCIDYAHAQLLSGDVQEAMDALSDDDEEGRDE